MILPDLRVRRHSNVGIGENSTSWALGSIGDYLDLLITERLLKLHQRARECDDKEEEE